MIEKYFLNVAVYRVDQDEYYRQRDAKIEKSLESSWRKFNPTEKQLKQGREAREQHDHDTYGPWEFNEIVGHIRLHLLGSQIRGEYFSAEGKRIGLSRKRVFKWQTHKLAAEYNLWGALGNQQLFDAVHEYLDRCQSELRPGRHIDRRTLNALGPHLNWMNLLERNYEIDETK